jgi:hypothetical protein
MTEKHKVLQENLALVTQLDHIIGPVFNVNIYSPLDNALLQLKRSLLLEALESEGISVGFPNKDKFPDQENHAK